MKQKKQRKSRKKRIKPQSAQSLNIPKAIKTAIQYHNSGRFAEAEKLYKQVLNVDPNNIDGLHLLGLIANQNGQFASARDMISKAVSQKDDFFQAHSNLSTVFMNLGNFADAVACAQKAIALNPQFAPAYNNLGSALQNMGRNEEAINCFENALRLDPQFGEAYENLGISLLSCGDGNGAFHNHLKALSLMPNNDKVWHSLAQSLAHVSFDYIDDNLWQLFLNVLNHPAVSPVDITRSFARLMRSHPVVSDVLSKVSADTSPTTNIECAEQLAQVPLFLRFIELCYIPDLEIEQMLTTLRRSLTVLAINGNDVSGALSFLCALARHCFVTEYAYLETEADKNAISVLESLVADQMETSKVPTSAHVALLGTYRSLVKFPWADDLSALSYDSNVKDMLQCLITEPLQERQLRKDIVSHTPIHNAVSKTMRAHYEDNPYPRWNKVGMLEQSASVDTVLRRALNNVDLGDYSPPTKPDILIAGCGTGQQALFSAARFANANIFAMDLSLSSLAYAVRKTKEANITNIQYVHGDIAEFITVDRQFDVIECVGVLHHMEDPYLGWKNLCAHLKPGGFMSIGLYSKTARASIVEGREWIAQKGYQASPDDMRQCREDIKEQAKNGNQNMGKLCGTFDFYSLSNFRDMLFNAQEHHFTIPKIQAALEELDLQFLGFHFKDPHIIRVFRKSYPDQDDLLNLKNWHEFEGDNPDTFWGMYNFWCQKRWS